MHTYVIARVEAKVTSYCLINSYDKPLKGHENLLYNHYIKAFFITLYLQAPLHWMLSQHSVKIVKIHCHLKDMAFSIKCALFLFIMKSGSIVFEYETVKLYLIATISYK